jgi:hypothetical protein
MFPCVLHCSVPMLAKKSPGYAGAFPSKHPISVAGGRRHSPVVSRPIRLDRNIGRRRIGVAVSKPLARRRAFQPLILMMPGGGRRLHCQSSNQQSSEDGKNSRSHCYLLLRIFQKMRFASSRTLDVAMVRRSDNLRSSEQTINPQLIIPAICSPKPWLNARRRVQRDWAF